MIKKSVAYLLFFLLILSSLLVISSCGGEAKINSSVKLNYLSEQEYSDNLADTKTNSGLTVGVGEKGYVVVDFTLSGLKKVSENAVATVKVNFSTDSVVSFKLEAEEMPSSDYTVSGASVTSNFKIYDGVKDEKTFRIIVSVIGNGVSELSVQATISIPEIAVKGQTSAWGSLSVKESAVKESKLLYRISSDGTYYIVTGLDGETGDKIIIPDTYEDKPVKEIADGVFCEIKYITEVTLPSGLTKIGARAFKNCTSLKTIFIPSSVAVIGDEAFSGCSEICINCGAAEKPSTWSESSISDALHVAWLFDKNFVLKLSNDGMFYILESAKYVSGEVTVPKEYCGLPVKEIGSDAFSFCTELTAVTIPDSIQAIGSRAFEGCTSLESIVIPSGVKSIESDTFARCSSLASVTLPSVITYIDTGAFSECVNLKNIILPENLVHLGSYVFYKCNSLTEIVIPDKVTAIQEYLFYSCEALTSVTVGSSVSEIYDNSFSECKSLNAIIFKDTTTWYCVESFIQMTDKSGGTHTSVNNAADNAHTFTSYIEYMWYKK